MKQDKITHHSSASLLNRPSHTHCDWCTTSC